MADANQLDPNTVINGTDGEWVQSVADPDTPGSTPENTYAYVRRYADGRVVTQYFRRGNDPKVPDPVARTAYSTNPDQARIFTEAKARAATQAGDTTVPGIRSAPGIDPSNGMPAMVTEYPNNPNKSYRPLTAAEMTQAGYTGRIEGAPLPGGGTDNEHPVWVVRGPGNVVVGAPRELTSDERKAWNEDRQRSRNPGGRTDVEAAAQQPVTKREEVPGHPGIYHVVTQVPATATSGASVDDHYEDASRATVPQPSDITNASITYRKNPQTGQLEKVTTTTVNGAKSETVAPVLPNERTQVGTKTTTANGKTVKVTTWQLPDGSTIDTTDEASSSADAPLPKGAPEFTPDPADPVGDMGLTAYNHALHEAESSGLIDHAQATKLLEQATPIANAAYVHQRDQQAQATTNRSQDIIQRGQTLGETQSRRSASDTGFDAAQTLYMGGAAHLGAGHGGTAGAAFREALMLRQASAQQAGGYADSPPVPLSPAMQSIRTTHYPDGTVVHENPGAPAAPATAAAPVVAPVFAPPPPVGADPMAPIPGVHMIPSASSPATVPTASALPPADEFGHTPPPPPVNPPAGQPGNDPNVPVGMVPAYLQPARNQAPVFDPSSTIAELRQRGFSDAAIAEALQQHQQETGVAA